MLEIKRGFEYIKFKISFQINGQSKVLFIRMEVENLIKMKFWKSSVLMMKIIIKIL